MATVSKKPQFIEARHSLVFWQQNIFEMEDPSPRGECGASPRLLARFWLLWRLLLYSLELLLFSQSFLTSFGSLDGVSGLLVPFGMELW